VIDPLRRWSGIGEKPDYAGPLSYGGVPYTQEPSDLGGADVVIVGAPTDELVSDRPGTRFAPRAIRAASCPPGPKLETGVDAFAELRVPDFGDAPVVPADPARSHRHSALPGLARRRLCGRERGDDSIGSPPQLPGAPGLGEDASHKGAGQLVSTPP
jgi:hypothetical protein